MPKPITEQLLDLLLPTHCVVCLAEGPWWCQTCQQAVTLVRPTTCALCGKAAVNGICPKCQAKTKIDGIITLFNYQNPAVQKLVTTYKYAGYSSVAGFVARAFGRKIIKQLPEDAAITYVPLDTGRFAKRGFNQSALLAQTICGETVSLFSKKRSTPAQATLGKQERRKNLTKAFAVKRAPLPEKIVIFDDVITTGATVAELAKLAKRKGTKQVWAVALAHD